MNVRRGEVVLVDFPYSDHTGSKVRPALVVQADALNRRLDDTILALITSSRHRRVGAATQFAIDITTPEGQQTGLRLNSVIQCENLLTYDQALILRVLGRLSATAIEQIDACLKAVLGIPLGVSGTCAIALGKRIRRRKVPGESECHAYAAPNNALQWTAYSLRSFVAAASGSS